jgi:hypothetical protein
MRILPVLAAALALAAPAAHAGPRDWPQLEGGAGVPECQRAFDAAREMHRSNENYLYAPFTPSAASGDSLVLHREAVVLLAEDALIHDDTVIERVDYAHGHGRSFWQRRPHQGMQLVVDVDQYGWRGDGYDVYSVPAATLRATFDTPNHSVPNLEPIAVGGGQPPTILRNADGLLWFIAFDGYALAPWRVHLAGANAAQPACTISFRPEGRNAFDLLPADVLLFATQIDETLGDGRNEGTLQQTARDRARMQHVWANAVYRPWAVAETSYGSREEVDRGMRRWARQAASFRAQYDAMMEQYPRAEAALAAYYKSEFEITGDQARRVAAYVINAAYTSSYTFHRDDYRPPAREPNPWPERR